MRGEPWTDLRDLLNRAEFDNVRREDQPAAAKQLLADFPTVEALDAYEAEIRRAALAPPDRQDARAMIGLMLAAFPNARPVDLGAYADSLLHYVVSDGYSPTVLAEACGQIVRKSTFAPSIAEVLAACEQARASLQSRLGIVAMVRRHRERVERRAA
ncbi:hypothetical protein DJ019_02340 [Phenylobacterium kunshanense]|uniref:Uncharacterized protein n=1 Tax=Phenylobacterium kunshanense TaxID=1445034 RepID=A0A328BSQ5_9CAUL|nr:hypothetical protein DJ019_02340 [Phenylobacterium kunshanense]